MARSVLLWFGGMCEATIPQADPPSIMAAERFGTWAGSVFLKEPEADASLTSRSLGRWVYPCRRCGRLSQSHWWFWPLTPWRDCRGLCSRQMLCQSWGIPRMTPSISSCWMQNLLGLRGRAMNACQRCSPEWGSFGTHNRIFTRLNSVVGDLELNPVLGKHKLDCVHGDTYGEPVYGLSHALWYWVNKQSSTHLVFRGMSGTISSYRHM